MSEQLFIHQQALVEPGAQIGNGTRVWAFTHILPGARIGENCNICDQVFIENDVILGNRVTVKCGVQLWDGLRIGDDVFIGPNATFMNDPFPRSKQYPEKFAVTTIQAGASIGANATILPGITIGHNAMIGAGTVVTRDVPPYAIIYGNPGRIQGYVSAQKREVAAPKNTSQALEPSTVKGVCLYEMPLIRDLRGSLSVGEIGAQLPFTPQRYFIVFDVPSKEIRGEHAHKKLHQFLICVKGTCAIVVDDGARREEIMLDRPNLGVHVPPMTWTTHYRYSPDAVLLVLASAPYENDDYIRNYDEFLQMVR